MQRKQYSADFKARVVLKALSGEATTAELAKKFSIHPLMITKWKKQAVTALPSLFSRKPERQKEEWSQRESELFQKIGKLQYELDWLKKRQLLLTNEKRDIIVNDPADLTVSGRCDLLGLARSSFYYQPQGETAENLAIMHKIDELYTAHPTFGSRSMMAMFNRMGYGVNRKRISAGRLSHQFGGQAPNVRRTNLLLAELPEILRLILRYILQLVYTQRVQTPDGVVAVLISKDEYLVFVGVVMVMNPHPALLVCVVVSLSQYLYFGGRDEKLNSFPPCFARCRGKFHSTH